MSLAALLGVKPGLTALIGGGGKTTLLYALAEELKARGTVIVTTSTKIRVPEHLPVADPATPEALADLLKEVSPLCLGSPWPVTNADTSLRIGGRLISAPTALREPAGKLAAPSLPFGALVRAADHVLESPWPVTNADTSLRTGGRLISAPTALREPAGKLAAPSLPFGALVRAADHVLESPWPLTNADTSLRTGGRLISAPTALREPAGKLAAPSLPFGALVRAAGFVLVEADGSRGLPAKAHAAHEPVIPAEAGTVILVLGADAFGRPIREVCHRPELYAERVGAAPDTLLTPELAARIMQFEGYGNIIYVNKCETETAWKNAEALARLASVPVAAGSLLTGRFEKLNC